MAIMPARNGDFPMLTKINGRTKFFDADDSELSIVREKGSKHSHIVKYRSSTYRVFGGRHGGGYSHEWFVNPVGETAIFGTNVSGYINVRSLVGGIRLIVNA
jgi:hypothetical protein